MNIYIWFPLAFAGLGWLFSSRRFIIFMNKLTPIQGLLFYYVIIFLTLEILQFFGLIIGGVRMASLTQTFGEVLIIFAFFIIFDWESGWIQDVINDVRRSPQSNKDQHTKYGSMDCPNLYLQAEDGAVYYFFGMFTKNHEVQRYLSFVLTPALLALIGLYLTRGVVKRHLF